MEALKTWREAQHLSVPEAADKVGVERATWWRWEAGIRSIGLESIAKVSDATGIPRAVLRPDLAAKMAGAA